MDPKMFHPRRLGKSKLSLSDGKGLPRGRSGSIGGTPRLRHMAVGSSPLVAKPRSFRKERQKARPHKANEEVASQTIV